MSEIRTFEDLECWQFARQLTTLVYQATKTAICQKDFGFADQMRRAAISVMNNIAEGFERDSNIDYARFLYISKASAGEVRSMAYAGLDLGYFSQDEFDQLYQLSTRCSKTTWGLIKSVTQKSNWRTKALIFVALLCAPLATFNLPAIGGSASGGQPSTLNRDCSKTTWGLIKSVTKKSDWRTKIAIFIALLLTPIATFNLSAIGGSASGAKRPPLAGGQP